MGAQPAHHPHVGLHPVPLQPAAVEDAVVGHDVLVVAGRQALGVAVERVGVLHDELARPQHAGARAGLVALLGLELVEDQRQVAVGAHGLRNVERDDLLVRHPQHEVGPAPVLELEQLLDRVAAGAAPGLGGLQDRHQHLLAADRVDLLAHDLHRPLVHAPARGEERPQPRPHLADQPCPHHELVRGGLGVGRRLALGGQEVLGQPRHGAKRSPRDRVSA